MNAKELDRVLDKLGLSQADLARELEYDQSTVSRWLAGERTIPPLVARGIRQAEARFDADALLEQGGAPACPEAPASLAGANAFMSHAETCPLCIARTVMLNRVALGK